MHQDDIITELIDNMGALKRLLGSQLHSLSRSTALSRAQLELLFSIHHLQPVSFKTLALQLHLTPGAVSQMVDGLEKQGLTERHVDPTDRRSQFLKLSKKGNKLLRELEQRRKTFLEQLMHSLTTDELATWLRIQQKLIDHLQNTHTNTKETPT